LIPTEVRLLIVREKLSTQRRAIGLCRGRAFDTYCISWDVTHHFASIQPVVIRSGAAQHSSMNLEASQATWHEAYIKGEVQLPRSQRGETGAISEVVAV
jgi:hypothetical protein